MAGYRVELKGRGAAAQDGFARQLESMNRGEGSGLLFLEILPQDHNRFHRRMFLRNSAS